MGPELEQKEKSNLGVEVVFPNKENIMASQDVPDKLVHCENDLPEQNVNEESLVQGEVKKMQDVKEDVEIDITECSPFGGYEQVEGGIQDSTESSSSFSDTMTRADNEAIMSDAESPLFDDETLGLALDKFDDPLRTRKRKLTDHWRRFVRPVMWRAKWLELRLKELTSQALKYDKELIKNEHKKQVEFEKITCEDSNPKSKPFLFHTQRNRAMKRKKRKRVEETTDLSAYMTHHNIFSYFGSKSGAANTAVENGLDAKAIQEDYDLGYDDGWSSAFEVGDSNDSLEQILWKIEVVKSQVGILRTRAQKLVTENPIKFSSINQLTMLAPCNGLMASENLALPTENGSKASNRPLHASVHREFSMEDLFRHRSTHGEEEEDILIHNQVAKEELRNYESGVNLQKEKPRTITPPEEKPQAAKLPEEKPRAIILPEEKPQAAKLPEEKPQAITVPEEKPQATNLPEEKPQAINLPEEKPKTIFSSAPAKGGVNFFTNTYKKSRTKSPPLASAPNSTPNTSQKPRTVSAALASGPNSSNSPKKSRKRKTRLPSTFPTKKRKKGIRKVKAEL